MRMFLATAATLFLTCGLLCSAMAAQQADVILHHGKVLTVDPHFRIAEALAVRGQRILAVGANSEILKLSGPETRKIDLAGKTVMPGLIDSHLHMMSSAMNEFDHRVPTMETIADVLQYVRSRAAVLKPGEWIGIDQVFITRLRDKRFPTRQELDDAAPRNPVVFRTGPDASVSSWALKLSGIDEQFKIPADEPGKVERDPQTGEPTGILRNCHRYVKYVSPEKKANAADRQTRLKALLAAYNEVGITSVSDRDTDDEDIEVFRALKDRGELSCRVYITYHVDAQAPWDKIEARVRGAARSPLHAYDNRLWLHGIKIYLDGGMLTGSAYMREPWGVSRIYSITDPKYRGILFIQPDRLTKIARLVLSSDLQLTAHCVGDAAVEALTAAYEQVDREFRVRPCRPCLSHANFMTLAAIERMQKVGIVADMQPVWLYLDGATLRTQFGDAR
ncbi:MAG: amidohydrolase family protein, partial [Thermoguttaceae bacterium]